jgi:prevent-host-death family protein
MVKEVGVYDAKARLTTLLVEVEHGASITITRHGRPIARLVPVEASAGGRDVVADFEAFRAKHPLRGLRVKDLVDEGRHR